ncbi:hypothetical protein AB0T83_03290 [Fluviibacterium sp. DFM31]|uniref:Uncharacterized protein n=1 Tax=Meridianimarinicoccus marinus TaxID=3231483 RepID=A0ABV3L2N1_9RHOB
MSARAILLALSLAATGAAAETEVPVPLQRFLSDAIDACQDLDNGEIAVEPKALRRVDVSGDGTDDWVLDEAQLACSSAASLFCGTGGCMVHFLVGDTVTSYLAKGWEAVDFGPFRPILLQVHGSNCGGFGYNTCVEAVVWQEDEKRFFSVRPVAE